MEGLGHTARWVHFVLSVSQSGSCIFHGDPKFRVHVDWLFLASIGLVSWNMHILGRPDLHYPHIYISNSHYYERPEISGL